MLNTNIDFNSLPYSQHYNEAHLYNHSDINSFTKEWEKHSEINEAFNNLIKVIHNKVENEEYKKLTLYWIIRSQMFANMGVYLDCGIDVSKLPIINDHT